MRDRHRHVVGLSWLVVAVVSVGCSGSNPDPIVAQVWSKNGFDGASYEYKINDFETHPHPSDGLLYGLDAVEVHEPDGGVVPLVQEFSGPVGDGAANPRWVIYGPAGVGFPESGRYTFVLLEDGDEVRRTHVEYVAGHIGFPTGVVATLDGDVLTVAWLPPAAAAATVAFYKVLVYVAYSPTLVVSEVVEGGASSQLIVEDATARLDGGQEYEVKVAAYGDEAFAYGAPFLLDLAPPK